MRENSKEKTNTVNSIFFFPGFLVEFFLKSQENSPKKIGRNRKCGIWDPENWEFPEFWGQKLGIVFKFRGKKLGISLNF